MDLVLTFFGCSVCVFTTLYFPSIKGHIKSKLLVKTNDNSITTEIVSDRFISEEDILEKYFEAYDYLASQFAVRQNVLEETKDINDRIYYVQKYNTNQPRCLIPSGKYERLDFQKHFITIANLYKESDRDDLLNKYLRPNTTERHKQVERQADVLGISIIRGDRFEL